MPTTEGFVKNRYQTPRFLVVVWGILALVFSASAQTTNAGKVVGSISDPTGAVVPKAQVQLVNTGTNQTLAAAADDSGGFNFPVVPPGNYRLTVTMAGFRTATITDIQVDVEKTTTIPVKLEVGGATETVEVAATAAAQLQTQDSQIGNVMSTDNILRLPTLQRNATELMGLQPGASASPTSGTGNLVIRVAGAIDDQNTVTLDGFDITSNIVATNTSVPTPADSVEEFRESVSNPSATLMRGSGGQVSLIGRRGSNDFHGALYEYLQNNDLNANTWDNNRAGLPKAIIHDNRFGGRIGGPIQKNKTFFFANYEGRRFSTISQVTRTVPTAALRNGIVQFVGPNGTEQFNLKTAQVCGANGTSACDPRGLGVDPSIAAQWADMPLPNLAGGDGLNTMSYFANLPTPIQTNYGVVRLDHVFNEKFTLNMTTTYWYSNQVASGDISIQGGNPMSVETTPQRTIFPTAQLTWQISPSLLNIGRIGWVRDTSQTNATSPTKAAGILNIPGTQTADGPVALDIGSGVSSFIDSPIDMDTQRARFQAAWQQDRQVSDDLTKIIGKHQIQVGAQINELPFTHARADKVVGSITSLVALVDGDQTFLTIPSANRPQTCSGSLGNNCIPSSQLTNWDRYYASALGMVDNVGILAVRNQNLQPQPLGTFLRDVTTQWATYFYVQDSWRIKPSLTLYYGFNYGWNTSPTEQHNLQTIQTYASSGQEVTGPAFINAKMAAAEAGQIYNPTFGFDPVGVINKPVFNIDWGDFAPRASLAWNPSGGSSAFGKILGERKTVVRGGFAIVYDRSNTVQSIEIPMLGIGFDQNINVPIPACNMTGPGGAGCNSTGGVLANPGLAAFRVGIDGTLPLPTPSAVTAPVIPTPGQETLSFQVDPNMKIGRSYNFDLSIQRELPGSMVLEVAYVGRAGRRLPQGVNLNSFPYMLKDPTSGQTFAQAYDTVANELRQGQAATVQPWFEDYFPGLATANGAANATTYIVNANKSLIVGGNVGNLALNLDAYRRSLSLQAFDSDQAQVQHLRTYIGYSNYQAGIITLTKRMSHGFTVMGNYTLSKGLDDGISNQNNAGFYSNSFDPSVNYGPSAYDRRSVVNATFQYNLPAGQGHMLHGNGVVNGILGGWYTSGIFSAWTGLPVHVSEGTNIWGGATSAISATDYMIPTGPIPSAGLNHHVSNTTTCSNSIFSGTVGANVGGSSGTNLDLFSNPGAAFCDFRYVELSSDGRTGSANPFYGLPLWNLDMRFGKDTTIKENWKLGFSADFFNIFNHENFQNPSPSFSSPATFGVITSTFAPPNRTNSARWIEMGLRLDF